MIITADAIDGSARVSTLSSGQTGRCIACDTVLRPSALAGGLPARRCPRCGLLSLPPGLAIGTDPVVEHHTNVDPHGAVAASKTRFYEQVLRRFDAGVPRRPRTLLDVGCGFGYFLERAAAAGWQAMGADPMSAAVRAARIRVPAGRLVAADLRGAGFPAASADAVSLWDVLDLMVDPPAELAECRRLLAPGGTIGIRVRNLNGQLWLSGLWTVCLRLRACTALKPPFVLHRYSFTPAAVHRLLERSGFVDVDCGPSPLTQGDPYAHSTVRGLTGAVKKSIAAAAVAARWLSGGRLLLSPSLLVWARKPLL